ncbi:hypothetical protein [Mycobacterium sp. 050134]|uniref:hypothetical protein n=1 Tax=Mycobacterium sp. 050134 TaxID=3096111 RepID=UPI002ED90244
MTSLAEVLKYVGTTAAGGLITYGLTWLREHRRSLDAYRAPQRQAIGEILAANFEFMARELDYRNAIAELAERATQPQSVIEQGGGESMAAAKAAGSAGHALDKALAVGTLTIVEPPCWEALGAAYVEFDRFRKLKAEAPLMQNAEDVTSYLTTLEDQAAKVNSAVSALVRSAINRLSPAEALTNRWGRRSARRRLGRRYQQPPQTDTPQPHY